MDINLINGGSMRLINKLLQKLNSVASLLLDFIDDHFSLTHP